jgi:hypothetical protein
VAHFSHSAQAPTPRARPSSSPRGLPRTARAQRPTPSRLNPRDPAARASLSHQRPRARLPATLTRAQAHASAPHSHVRLHQPAPRSSSTPPHAHNTASGPARLSPRERARPAHTRGPANTPPSAQRPHRASASSPRPAGPTCQRSRASPARRCASANPGPLVSPVPFLRIPLAQRPRPKSPAQRQGISLLDCTP